MITRLPCSLAAQDSLCGMGGSCLLDYLKTQGPELKLFTHAVPLLSTHGWKRTENPSFGNAALDVICKWFGVPLERADIDCEFFVDETHQELPTHVPWRIYS